MDNATWISSKCYHKFKRVGHQLISLFHLHFMIFIIEIMLQILDGDVHLAKTKVIHKNNLTVTAFCEM